MMTHFSLLTALAPALPGDKVQPLTLKPSGAPLAPIKSFFTVMSQVRRDGLQELPGEAKASTGDPSPAKTPQPPGKTADIHAAAASTLIAVMGRPQISAGEIRKPAAARAVNPKSAPAGKEDEVRPVARTSGRDAAASETPQPPSAPPDQAPLAVTPRRPLAAGESGKQVFAQPINHKVAPAGRRDEEAQPLKETAETSAGGAPSKETSTPPTESPGKTFDADISLSIILMFVPIPSQIAVVPSSNPTSAQSINIKIAPEQGAAPLALPVALETKPEGKAPAILPSALENKLESKTPVALSSALESKPESKAPVALPSASETKPEGKMSVVLPSAPESKTPVVKAIDPHPIEISISPKRPAVQPAELAGSSKQPVEAQIAITQPMVSISVVSSDGTGGALSSQRMNFEGKKNEIAGRTEQNVPPAPQKSDVSVKAASEVALGSDSDHSGPKQDSIDSALVMDWPNKSGGLTLDAGKGTGIAPSIDHSAAQIEHVGRLVNQQVSMMRQSGANNLAVSLKVDPQTELSLQLTNHNGQMEASIRWERGATTGLDSHWKDLQESLARVNVQLLPLENKVSSRTPALDSEPQAASASSFNQTSQNPQRQSREARQDLPLAGAVVTVSATATNKTNKTTTRTVSRQGWESWA